MQSSTAHQEFSRLLHHFARSIIFLVLLGILLDACGQSTLNTTASPSGKNSQGTLSGNVMLSPTCPLQGTDGDCPSRAAAFRQVRIMSNKQVVATTTTDKQGHFDIHLNPGDYAVLVNNLSPGVRRPAQGVPVHIKAGQVSTVKIVLDTGIR